MIQASELRIGNWVQMTEEHFELRDDVDLSTRMFKIKGFNDGSGRKGCRQIFFWEIHLKGGFGRCCSGSHDIDCEPIPLTPEILEKAGFARIDTALFCNDEFNLYGTGPFRWSLANTVILGEVKFLHQLQNLSYALIGEEINIQL